jgi:DNA-binding transcriptional LysR family regulator
MDLSQVEAFVAVAEELHFGRAAERLNLSQPRVSRLVAALESDVGGALFERTSRRVRLTPLGVQLRDGLRPAHARLKAVFDDARAAARGKIGPLRIGVTETTGGEVVTRLIRAFEPVCPGVTVTVHGVTGFDPFGPLRGHEIDVLVNWLSVDAPDMTRGPIIDYRERVLALGLDHPLATRRSVSIEELAEYEVVNVPPPFPRALHDTLIPPRTPAGRSIRRTVMARSTAEVISLVACNRIVHPTVTSVALLNRSDIAFVRIEDMAPLPLGLIWCSAHRNARIAALAKVAAKFASASKRDPAGPAPLY